MVSVNTTKKGGRSGHDVSRLTYGLGVYESRCISLFNDLNFSGAFRIYKRGLSDICIAWNTANNVAHFLATASPLEVFYFIFCFLMIPSATLHSVFGGSHCMLHITISRHLTKHMYQNQKTCTSTYTS